MNSRSSYSPLEFRNPNLPQRHNDTTIHNAVRAPHLNSKTQRHRGHTEPQVRRNDKGTVDHRLEGDATCENDLHSKATLLGHVRLQGAADLLSRKGFLVFT